MEREQCCGTCKWHKPEPGNEGAEWVCENPDSMHYSDFTPYNYDCPDFEER